MMLHFLILTCNLYSNILPTVCSTIVDTILSEILIRAGNHGPYFSHHCKIYYQMVYTPSGLCFTRHMAVINFANTAHPYVLTAYLAVLVISNAWVLQCLKMSGIMMHPWTNCMCMPYPIRFTMSMNFFVYASLFCSFCFFLIIYCVFLPNWGIFHSYLFNSAVL